MSQNKEILRLLKRGPLTPLGALHLANCMRLSARIYDLRAQGHVIDSLLVPVRGKMVARYTLRKHK